jgi:predicted permease
MTDLRFAARMLRKNPGFSAIAIATLALGIGANTAIFSVVDAVILRPLAYPDAGRLFAIHEIVPKFSRFAPLIPVNGAHFLEWRKSVNSFEELALLNGYTVNLTGANEPERVPMARVSSNLFPMLGVQAQLGRTFTAEEDRSGHDRVVVLDDALWRRRFGGDRNVIGRMIALDGASYEVIGVLPGNLRFPKLSQLFALSIAEERPEIWKPLALRDSELESLGDFDFACIARLKRGISGAQASAELNAVQARITNQMPEKVELKASLVPLREQITGRSRTGLELMLGAIGAVLLIGCVNIANLLLARASARRREIAIRSAIGAGSGRLMRQMLAESLLLSGLGGLLGVAIAYGAVRLILEYAPVDLPRLDEVRLDWRVLGFTVAISVLSGLFFGLLPAWRASRTDPQEAMKSGARGTTAGRSSGRLRSALVGVEVGLGAMCLIAGGLLLHSFIKLLQVDRGFEVRRIVTVALNLPDSRYSSTQKRAAFFRAVLEQVGALPGVVSAGISNMLPLGGEGNNNLLSVEGATVPFTERPLADVRQVNPEYFRTMGIPLRAGQMFSEADRDRKVMLVSAMTAERVWPGQSPIGKRVRIGDEKAELMEVTGVVGDVRGVSLNKGATMTVYVPYWQRCNSSESLAVKTAADPAALSPSIRNVIRRMDPDLPAPAFRTMEDIMAESVAQRRFQMNMVALFAVAAMLLASLGIYGVVAYSVTQRTNEMGIRLALGAQPGSLRRMVARECLLPVAIGLGAGVAISMAMGRVLGSLLFGVNASDPITIAGVVALLGVVGAAASYIPARRATLVDPVRALRYE